MQVGLLWFDNDPRRAVASKIEEAATRYREKFGCIPDVCYVNSVDLNGQGLVVTLAGLPEASVRVLPARNILPHHFWVGVEESVIRRA
jgi:hypothetical protein